MRLYFVQHGLAVAKEVDAERPLSEAGYNESGKVADYLKKYNLKINKICHSGKLRAKQTAEIFAKKLNIGEIVEVLGMTPKDAPNLLIDNLLEDGAMYIGHLPNLQKVVSQLVAKNETSDLIQFKNSAVVCVEVDENTNSSILWFVPPSMC